MFVAVVVVALVVVIDHDDAAVTVVAYPYYFVRLLALLPTQVNQRRDLHCDGRHALTMCCAPHNGEAPTAECVTQLIL